MRKDVAALVAGSAVAAAQLVGAHWSPAPTHPKTALWYARLRKPWFTPPGPVLGLAWTALDALLGYSGYRLMTAPPSARRGWAIGAWWMNLMGIAGFSWVLFGRKRLDEALDVTAVMVGTSVAAAATAASVDRRAGAVDLPMVAWVVFACLLQEEVWRRNR